MIQGKLCGGSIFLSKVLKEVMGVDRWKGWVVGVGGSGEKD